MWANSFFTMSTFQDHGCQAGVQASLTVPKLREKVLRDVGHALQIGEREKSARAFNGVNGTEDASQELEVVRTLLQFDSLPLQPGQILGTLDQELFDNVLVFH